MRRVQWENAAICAAGSSIRSSSQWALSGDAFQGFFHQCAGLGSYLHHHECISLSLHKKMFILDDPYRK
jgi:hypothetical protein